MEFKRISSIYTSHLEVDDINQALNNYEPTLLKQCSALMHDKRGLLSGTSNNRANSDVINIWINILVIEKMDSSATFRQLCQFDMLAIIKACVISLLIVKYLMNGSTFIYQLLRVQYINQTQRRTQMRLRNPNIVLRNYLAQQVIDQAERGGFEMFQPLIDALKNHTKK